MTWRQIEISNYDDVKIANNVDPKIQLTTKKHTIQRPHISNEISKKPEGMLK